MLAGEDKREEYSELRERRVVEYVSLVYDQNTCPTLSHRLSCPERKILSTYISVGVGRFGQELPCHRLEIRKSMYDRRIAGGRPRANRWS
jgi:hypothetical protein